MPLTSRFMAALLMLVPLAGLAQSASEPVPGAIIVDGASAFSQQQFFPLYRDLLGEPLTRQRQEQLKQTITSLYTDQGYAAPGVRIALGNRSVQVVTVSIDEPTVAGLEITGFSQSVARSLRQVASSALDYPGPLSGAQLDALGSRLEDIADRRLDVALEKRPAAGARYTMVVSARQQLRGSISYSLEGSDSLGRQLVYGRLTVDNPARYASAAYLSALHTVTSDGFRNFGAGVTLAPAASHRVDLATSFARAKPQDTNQDEVLDRQWYRLRWNHNLIQDIRREMDLFSSFTFRDYTFDVNSQTRVDEQLRVAGLGLDNRWRWRGRTLFLRVGGRQGIDSLGAQREGPGAIRDTDLDFRVLKTRATLWQALPADFSFRLDVGGQYSRDQLPFSERFSIGGYRYARAYEPGEFTGDRGLGSKLEVRRGFSLPALADARLVPYAYYGVARTFDNQRNQNRSGAAAGAGVRLLGERFYAYLELGQPLTTASDYRDDDLRMTGRLTIRLP